MAYANHKAKNHAPAQYTSTAPGLSGGPAKPCGACSVLLHGFTQTGASWLPVRAHLGDRPVLLPDLPGHGTASTVVAGLWEAADIQAQLAPEGAYWAGYSLGGRLALHVALAHPGVVRRLVLVSATPGIPDEEERAERRASDEDLAERLERDGVEAFLRSWLAQPLFATLPPSEAGLRGRLQNTAAGLASSLRRAGTGTQDNLWDRLSELAVRGLPVLLIAGQGDAKFVAIARSMADAIGPSASLFVVPGAGHACHLEEPELVGKAIGRFCDEGDRAADENGTVASESETAARAGGTEGRSDGDPSRQQEAQS